MIERAEVHKAESKYPVIITNPTTPEQKAANKQIIGEFFEAEHARLLNFVVSKGFRKLDAEDIISKGILAVLKFVNKNESGEPIKHLRGFVYKKIHFEMIDFIRSRQRDNTENRTVYVGSNSQVDSISGASEPFDSFLTFAELQTVDTDYESFKRKLVPILSEQEFEFINKLYLEPFEQKLPVSVWPSQKDVAEELMKTVGSIKRSLFDARNKLNDRKIYILGENEVPPALNREPLAQ